MLLLTFISKDLILHFILEHNNVAFRILLNLDGILQDPGHSLIIRELFEWQHKQVEAQNKKCKTAALIVLVFKSKGKVTEEKVAANHKDVEAFLNATKADKENGLYVIPNNTNIKLYFKEIVI